MTKCPYVAPGRRASVAAPQTWLTLDRATGLAAVFDDQGAAAGLGILLGDLGGDHLLICLDLDSARTDDGRLKPWAAEALDCLDGHYMEFSPSGGGVHVLFTATRGDLDAFDRALDQSLPRTITVRRKFRRFDAKDGLKVPAIELLTVGYSTVTGATVPCSGVRIRRVGPDALPTLARTAIPRLLGLNADSLEAGPEAPILDHVVGQFPRPIDAQPPERRAIRAAGSRLADFAARLDDASFQILFALWMHARKPNRGWARAAIGYDALNRLPGLDRYARLSRTTIAKRIRGLREAGLLRIVEPGIRPSGGRAGRVAVYEVAPLLVHYPDARATPEDLRRIPIETWTRMLDLPGRQLRVICWLWGRVGESAVTMSQGEIAQKLRMKRQAVGKAMQALSKAGLLMMETAFEGRRGRTGEHRINITPPPPPTPG